MPGRLLLLVGTRKGAFLYRGDGARRAWRMDGPHHLGAIVQHLVMDPRDRRTILMAASTGHLGPTVFRSTDTGRTWREAKRPPAFAKARAKGKGRSVKRVFWLTPGHAREAGVWYAGTTPQGLFRTEDGGATWSPVSGFNDHPMWSKWCDGGTGGTPSGPMMHSILVDPRDARHLYVSLSGGGTFESLDAGKGWTPLNGGVRADFWPGADKYPEYGHDPHCVVQHPAMPDRLYQQNHCGIYRIDRPSDRWVRIGDNMPRKTGDIGFPIAVHPRDPDTAWVVPMDGRTVWPRTSVDGKPAVYRTTDAGRSWERQDRGLPRADAWWTVKRQCLATDACGTLGLYFGTTGGMLWASRNEGGTWAPIAQHLPEIYCVSVGEPD